MNVPELDKVKRIIQNWGIKNPRIIKVYLFGSFVTKKNTLPSDIDVVIEISNKENDTASGFWCGEGKKMESELSQLLEYKVHLNPVDNNARNVKKGLNEGSLLIYQIGLKN